MSRPTPSPTSLDPVLAALRRRHRSVHAARLAAWGLLIGGAAACPLTLALWALQHASPTALATAAAGCMSAAAILGAIWGYLSPMDDLRLARSLDRAANSEDRLASALQLASSVPERHQARAALVLNDAIERTRKTPVASALPVSFPRAVKFIPLPIVVVLLLVLALPQAGVQAVSAPPAEVSPDEWASLHDEFKKELQQLPKPQTPEEEELQKQIEQLAAMLKENPEKKDVLKEIAKLSDRIEQQKRASGTARAQSMKAAAKALAASQSLKPFSQQLQEGSYEQAASELSKLSDQLKSGENSPDAKEFEAMAADLQRLSELMDTEKDLQSECQKCSGAAGSMNKQALSEAMKKFAEQMKKNAEKLRKCDGLCKRSSALEELKRKMGQCKGCKNGKPGNCNGDQDGEGFCQNPSAKKGGKKAGWGSAANWEGGSITKANEDRSPDMVNPLEQAGTNTTFQIVSPDEKAVSAKKYEELYAAFVAKNEADLDLESVPVAYREYLRKYFNSIRPKDSAPGATPAEKPE